MRKKVALKFFDRRKLVIAVKTKDLEEAKIIANEIFKVKKSELDASYAIIRGNELFYDGGYKADACNTVAVYRKQED